MDGKNLIFISIGLCAVSVLFLIIGTAGTEKGWFTTDFTINISTPMPEKIAHPTSRFLAHIQEQTRETGDMQPTIGLSYGTVSLTLTVSLFGNSISSSFPLSGNASTPFSDSGLASAGSASLAFCILGWLTTLVLMVFLCWWAFSANPDSSAIWFNTKVWLVLSSVALFWSLLAWTIYLAVINAKWSDIAAQIESQGITTSSATPNWAWVFTFLGFLSLLGNSIVQFLVLRHRGANTTPEYIT